MAYPLTKKRLKGLKFFSFLALFTMYFSGGLIPTYIVVTGLGLYRLREAISRYTRYAGEGELTRMRAELVRGASLARRGEALGLPALILHGNSMKGDLPQSLCEDAVEAILGAICLDGGLAAAERVLRLVLEDPREVVPEVPSAVRRVVVAGHHPHERDHSLLQDVVRLYGREPRGEE